MWIVSSCGVDSVSVDTRPGATIPPPVTEVGWGPLAVTGGSRSGDEALISGTLRITDDCVLLDEGDDPVLLVWLEEQTEWDPLTETVRYGGGDGSIAVLGSGDTVSFGGGGSSESEGGMTGPGRHLPRRRAITRPSRPHLVTRAHRHRTQAAKARR